MLKGIPNQELGFGLMGIGSAMSRAAQGQPFDLSNTAAQLYAMRQKRERDQKLKGLMGQIEDPQMRGLAGMFPEAYAQGMIQQKFSQPQQSALDQKISRLVESGVDRNVAIGIASGRFGIVTDPVEGGSYVMDKATGRPIQRLAQGRGAPTVPRGGGAPAQPPVAPPGATVPSGAPAGTPPPGADERNPNYPSAFGLEGGFKGALNVASDYLLGSQVFPDVADAQRQIDNINTQTATLLAQGVETRGGQYLIKRFDKIQAETGGIQGPEDALRTFEEVKQMLERAYQIDQNITQARVRPAEKSKARASMERLRPIISEYEKIIDEFRRQFYRKRFDKGLEDTGHNIPQLGVDVRMEDLKTGDRVRTPDGKIRIVP